MAFASDKAGLLAPGDTVYTVLRKVSRTGMSRRLDLYVIKDNQPVSITRFAADVLGYSMNKDGMLVRGCGMDMGFAVVYDLSCALFGDGYKLKQEWL